MASTTTLPSEGAVAVEQLVNPGEGKTISKLLQRIPLEDGGAVLQPLPSSIDFRLQPVDVSNTCMLLSDLLAHGDNHESQSPGWGAFKQVNLPLIRRLYQIYKQTHPIHYLDHGSFPCNQSEWIEWLGRIEDILEHGKQFIHMLYTFRCVSRAIPMVSVITTTPTHACFSNVLVIPLSLFCYY